MPDYVCLGVRPRRLNSCSAFRMQAASTYWKLTATHIMSCDMLQPQALLQSAHELLVKDSKNQMFAVPQG